MSAEADGQEDAKLAALLQQAPRHARASEAARARVAAAVEREWRAALESPGTVRAAPRARWPLALAASVVVALVGVFAWRTLGTATGPATVALAPPAAPVAVVLRVQGEASAQDAAARAAPAPLGIGAALTAGTRVASGSDAIVALDWGQGLSVRIGARTRVRIDAPDRLTLEEGMLYVDADPAGAPPALVVATVRGDVRHVGTQYLVSSDAAADRGLEVAVREGEISIDAHAGEPLKARAGESITLRAGTAPRRGRVAADDARWQWLQRAPSPFVLEGRTLGDFLRWYERETGRHVVLEGNAARTRAIVLHGSIDDLTPDDALDAVAASIDFVLRRSESGLSLRAR